MRPNVSRPFLGRPAWLQVLTVLLVGAALGSCRSTPEARVEQVEHRISLVSAYYDEESRQADKRLAEYLERELRAQGDSRFEIKLDSRSYEAAVTQLVEQAEDSTYVARLTPFVYVVAEMLGAEFEVVATYLSKAVLKGEAGDGGEDSAAGDRLSDGGRGFTYNAYIVVNLERMRSQLGPAIKDPSLLVLEEYLRSFTEPPTFIYHNKFSTSSFFLPSVYFRERGIIDMAARPGEGSPVIRIQTEDISQGKVISSKELVKRVAVGEGELAADLAAVWDGTKTAFEPGMELHDGFGSKVAFIALEDELPNDLLVVSSSMSAAVRELIRGAIDRMEETDIENEADFKLWRPIDEKETSKARSALAGLRQLARAQSSPVTVRVEAIENPKKEPVGAAALRDLRQAAEDAVRLSGSEFVLWSEYYAHSDFLWTFMPIHDGAVVLRSAIDGLEGWEQEFQISFKDDKDLTARVGDLIRSRMHRIRPVWPYSKSDAPTVLRDVDFSVPDDRSIQVQKIRWLNQETNEFVIEKKFKAQVIEADSRRFVLSGDRFDDVLNPMGAVSYRVVLPRPSEERPLFRALTVVLVVLFLAATVVAAFELRRVSSLPLAAPTQALDDAFSGMVEEYHEPWRTGVIAEIAEADVLGRDREAIEEVISRLKRAEGPWWRRLLSLLISEKDESQDEPNRGLTKELRVERDEIGTTERLAGLIEFLVQERKLSSFTGQSVEFEAWDQAAAELFPEGDRPDEGELRSLLREDCLKRPVSRHFDGVLKEARRSISLFHKMWTTKRHPRESAKWVFQVQEELPVALDPRCLALGEDVGRPPGEQQEPAPITDLLIEFKLDRPANQTVIDGQVISAWLLGLLDRPLTVVEGKKNERCLRLHFKPLAVVRGPEC